MNVVRIKEHYKYLSFILNARIACVGEKEAAYRQTKLDESFEKSIESKQIVQEFYSISHEIRSIDFFHNLDALEVSKDSDNEEGADLTFKEKYKIECVVCTPGIGKNLKNLNDCGYGKYTTGDVLDYIPLRDQISLRMISALDFKSKKYSKYVNHGVQSPDSPYLIFINLGALSCYWFPGDFCVSATRILTGRGDFILPIDIGNGKKNNITHDYIQSIKNNNRSDVDVNFFSPENNTGISAVIITTANLNQQYSKNNVYFFLNPFAKNKIKLSDFKNIRYWKSDKNSKYIPRINGKKQVISPFNP